MISIESLSLWWLRVTNENQMNLLSFHWGLRLASRDVVGLNHTNRSCRWWQIPCNTFRRTVEVQLNVSPQPAGRAATTKNVNGIWPFLEHFGRNTLQGFTTRWSINSSHQSSPKSRFASNRKHGTTPGHRSGSPPDKCGLSRPLVVPWSDINAASRHAKKIGPFGSLV